MSPMLFNSLWAAQKWAKQVFGEHGVVIKVAFMRDDERVVRSAAELEPLDEFFDDENGNGGRNH